LEVIKKHSIGFNDNIYARVLKNPELYSMLKVDPIVDAKIYQVRVYTSKSACYFLATITQKGHDALVALLKKNETRLVYPMTFERMQMILKHEKNTFPRIRPDTETDNTKYKKFELIPAMSSKDYVVYIIDKDDTRYIFCYVYSSILDDLKEMSSVLVYPMTSANLDLITKYQAGFRIDDIEKIKLSQYEDFEIHSGVHLDYRRVRVYNSTTNGNIDIDEYIVKDEILQHLV
jgi:hypothetical protein